MKSAKCPECGFVGWADAEFCKKCGAPVIAPPPDHNASPPPRSATANYPGDHHVATDVDEPQTYYYPPNVNPFPEDLKNGWAISSLVGGILNFLLLGIFVLPTIAGIVISAVALKKINRRPLEYGGKGMAVGGLVLNIVSAVALIPILLIAAIAIPNLMAARRAANEGAAIVSLRKFHRAEMDHYMMQRKYGTLGDLMQKDLIGADLASGERSGYRFAIEVLNDRGDGWPGFTVVGVPKEYNYTGRRSFFVDYTGVIRAADSHGLEATKYDPPLNPDYDTPLRSSRSRPQPDE
jgi:hypothetical protein